MERNFKNKRREEWKAVKKDLKDWYDDVVMDEKARAEEIMNAYEKGQGLF